ncbi:MAG: M3 family oligoendopeptidase [Oscillospiraceae bacterium]|nr:M3 family oligoendopeptidase [Oscillospiraceae bacterium]
MNKTMTIFRELPYERPDVKKIKKEITRYLRLFNDARTFEDADTAFLGLMDMLESCFTLSTIASIRNTMNTKDEFYDGEVRFFNKETAKLMLILKKGIKAMLSSSFRTQFEEKYGTHLFEQMETRLKLIKPTIILPTIREGNLQTEYSKTAASCSVEFMGEKCNFYGLLRHMQSTDRSERRAAFEEWAKLYEGVSGKLEEQYGKLVRLRSTMARRLGFKSYIDYIYLSRGRYDYNAKKVEEFRESVRRYITPLCEELYSEQAERLGVDELRWYDESLCFTEGNAVPIGTPEELTEKTLAMYKEMSPETGEFFGFMKEHELYDFVTRENKHLGGYTTFLPDYRAPFIFSNFNGTSADVDVLTHEAGHAFEAYYASRRLPIQLLTMSTSEINEIHSMSMEFFAYPYLESFFGDKADKYRYAHFTDAIKHIPYLVSVDEFQHRVFENPDSTPEDWRKIWKDIEKKYMPWRSYDGNAFLESGGFWMQKQHIFLFPFYYVDYAMAQMDAFALFRMRAEGGDAWGSYLKLCGMGGMYGYFETLERAGLPNPLDPDTVKGVAEFGKQYSDVLKDKISI